MFKSPAVSLSSADYLGRGEPAKTQCSESLFPFAPSLPSFPFSTAFCPFCLHLNHIWLMQSVAGALHLQGVQGLFLQGFVVLLGCDAPPLSQKDSSCLALPSSHLPSSISHPHLFLNFLSLSSSPFHPEVGPAL